MSARARVRVLPALLLVLAGACAAATSPPRAMTGAETVDGKRVDAYPALWWQWVNRKRWGAQAFQDPTGAQCALNQAGPVWYLAGTDGTDEVHRQCRIPSGKHVFLPIITMLETSVPALPRTCAQLKAEAAANNEHVVATEVSVDGVAIDIHPLRMAGDCFNGYAQADYLKNRDDGHPSATDGYWLMLAPLADGKHVLRIKVRYDNPGVSYGDMEQDFGYDLDVGGEAPEPAPEKLDEDHDWRQTNVQQGGFTLAAE